MTDDFKIIKLRDRLIAIHSEDNRIGWIVEPEKGDTKPRTMGHFVCFDRWGQPSPSEIENGMPFHGEAAQV